MTDKPETASAPFRVKVRVTKVRAYADDLAHYPMGRIRIAAIFYPDGYAARALRNLGLEVT